MKARLGLALLLTAVIGLVPASASGEANFRWGTSVPLTNSPSVRVEHSCTPTATIWTQEVGKSGITRLRTQFAIRGPYDPGYLPSHWKSNWAKSGIFPDDFQNYYQPFALSFDGITVGPGKHVAVWAKMIGEKPSFWHRDAKIHKSLGTFICQGGGIPPA